MPKGFKAGNSKNKTQTYSSTTWWTDLIPLTKGLVDGDIYVFLDINTIYLSLYYAAHNIQLSNTNDKLHKREVKREREGKKAID